MADKKKTNQTSQEQDQEQTADLPVESPAEMYAPAEELSFEGHTFWARLRRWSHRMKRVVYIIFLGSLIGGFAYLMREDNGPGSGGLIAAYFNRFDDERPDWIYHIGAYQMDPEFMRRLYPVLANFTYGEAGARELRQSGPVYQEYLKQQYETDLMAFAAWQSGALEDPEAKLIMENALRRAAADYYLYKNIKNENSDFRVSVSDAEALAFYQKNKAVYDKQGMDQVRALALIRGTLSDVKASQVRANLQASRKAMLDRLRDEIGPRFRGDK